MLNRGNGRMDLFTKDGDFAAFVTLIELARQRFPSIRVLAFCLMHNHWHLVLWPQRGTDLSRFMAWLSNTHVRRWRAHRDNIGHGHLYQGRFKSFIVQPDELHLLTVLRYVEANPLRARMVRRAEDWRWSSLGKCVGVGNVRVQMCDWPIDRPRGWVATVNELLSEPSLAQVRASIRRDRPLGTDRWTQRVAKQMGLESTLRNPWRPKIASKKPSRTPRMRKQRDTDNRAR